MPAILLTTHVFCLFKFALSSILCAVEIENCPLYTTVVPEQSTVTNIPKNNLYLAATQPLTQAQNTTI
jgi:hypothetical protein